MARRQRTSLLEKILAQSSPEPMSGCWLWTGYCYSNGYASVEVSRCRSKLAHRISYELFVGPIPKGLELDHKCRVRCCINPDHLEPVTHAENMRRSPNTLSSKNIVKTRCIAGHLYDEANTGIWHGTRRCRICDARRHREKRAALREEASALPGVVS